VNFEREDWKRSWKNQFNWKNVD